MKFGIQSFCHVVLFILSSVNCAIYVEWAITLPSAEDSLLRDKTWALQELWFRHYKREELFSEIPLLTYGNFLSGQQLKQRVLFKNADALNAYLTSTLRNTDLMDQTEELREQWLLESGFLKGTFPTSLDFMVEKVWPGISIDTRTSVNLLSQGPLVQGFINSQDKGTDSDVVILNYSWTYDSRENHLDAQNMIKSWMQHLSLKGLVYDEIQSWKFWPTMQGFMCSMQFKDANSLGQYYSLTKDGKTFAESMEAKAITTFEQVVGSASNFNSLGFDSKQVWDGIPYTSLYGSNYFGIVGGGLEPDPTPAPGNDSSDESDQTSGDWTWTWTWGNSNSTSSGNITLNPAERSCVRKYVFNWLVIFSADITASMINLNTSEEYMWVSAGSYQVFAWFFGFFEGFILLIMWMAAGDMELAAKIFRICRQGSSVVALIFAGLAPMQNEETGQNYERNMLWSVLSTFLGFWLYRTVPSTCALPVEDEEEVDTVAQAIAEVSVADVSEIDMQAADL